ncbi:MAG: hypothetical protein ACPG05_00915 [Bdellovibrionales bacterium]
MSKERKTSVAASVDNVSRSALQDKFLTEAIRAERFRKGGMGGTPINIPVFVTNPLNLGLGSKK